MAVVAMRPTFFVMTKLEPCEVKLVSFRANKTFGPRRVPIASVDNIAKVKPIHLSSTILMRRSKRMCDLLSGLLGRVKTEGVSSFAHCERNTG